MEKTFYVTFVEYDFEKIMKLRLWANNKKGFEIICTAPAGNMIYISATKEGLEDFKNNLQGFIIDSITEEESDSLTITR